MCVWGWDRTLKSFFGLGMNYFLLGGVNECLWLGDTCVGVHTCVCVYGDQTCSLAVLYHQYFDEKHL